MVKWVKEISWLQLLVILMLFLHVVKMDGIQIHIQWLKRMAFFMEEVSLMIRVALLPAWLQWKSSRIWIFQWIREFVWSWDVTKKQVLPAWNIMLIMMNSQIMVLHQMVISHVSMVKRVSWVHTMYPRKQILLILMVVLQEISSAAAVISLLKNVLSLRRS